MLFKSISNYIRHEKPNDRLSMAHLIPEEFVQFFSIVDGLKCSSEIEYASSSDNYVFYLKTSENFSFI